MKKKIDYTLRVAIRHEDAALLEKLRSLPLHLDRVLDTAVTVPVYSSNHAAVTAGKTTDGGPLQAGAAMSIFLGPVPDDKLPKDAMAGKLLLGKLTLGKSQSSGSAAPGGISIALGCPPAKETDKSSADSNDKLDKSEADKLSEAVRDAKVVAAADEVVAAIDEAELAAFVARKCHSDDSSPEAAAVKKEMEEKKSALIDALACKCTALLDLEAKNTDDNKFDSSAGKDNQP
eukprot:scaffold235531_cov34-Prasinocladus_malaysianus.AAC.1